MTPQDLSIEAFERQVYARDYENAGRTLLELIKLLVEKGRLSDGGATDERGKARAQLRHATRLTAAITSLLADPNFHLSEPGFQRFTVNLPYIHGLFRMSPFGNMDHLVPLVATVQGGQVSVPNKRALMKLLLTQSVYSELDLDFAGLFRAAPELGIWVYLAMLEVTEVFTERAEQRRQALLDMRQLLDTATINEHLVERVGNVWMLCSYALADDRHQIKPHLNALLRRWVLSQDGVREPALPPVRPRRDKPTLLIPVERFRDGHAMFRCYAPYLREMRGRFRLVGMGQTKEVDDVGRQLFDEFHDLPDLPSFRDVIATAVRAQPDMVYYPSLGMSGWAVALANVRLAPIQIAALGHPASTFIPTIDYALINEFLLSDPKLFSERVVVLPGLGFFGEAPPGESIPVPPPRERPDPLVIAVPSALFKINSRFLDVCRRIQQAARREVEFRFFPNAAGVQYQRTRTVLLDVLPNAVCYPRADYRTYVNWLSECDLRLGTFPFGGSNSNVDTLSMGIPMVALDGPEPHARTDGAYLRALGVPELVAQTEEEYIATALRLIGNDDERLALRQRILDQDPTTCFLRRGWRDYEGGFNGAMLEIYQRHEEFQAREDRVIRLGRESA